jgi:asparagine synthase (glutamine-hydrolysing)
MAAAGRTIPGVNTAPGQPWRTVKTAARGPPYALARAAKAVAAGQLLGDGLGMWTLCPIGAAIQWLTPYGRQVVARILEASARVAGDVNAGEWEDWAALRYNGATIRDCAPLFAEHGVNQVSPFLDNEVVTAYLRIGAGERRRPQTPAGHGPPRPAGLADRQAEQGHFTPLLYAGLRAHHQELHGLIDASTLVGHGLIDATAVHTALDAAAAIPAAAGIGRPPLPALENFLITSW